jgi:hypothetical protein
MLTLPPQQRIANAAAVLDGPHGAVTRRARQQRLSRQALYRDTQRLLRHLDPDHADQRRHQLRDHTVQLHAQIADLQAALDDAVLLDNDRLAAFAATAQAEGVSLPVARRLLAPLLARSAATVSVAARRLPSVAQLGRWSRQAACRAGALLEVLDAKSRPRVEQAAADEIFFGKRPCLMVIEQHSLCWVSGRLVPRRDGSEWAKEFRQLPTLRQATQDGGAGLAKGLATVNAERQQADQPPVAVQDDHFHVLRAGNRALRKMQQAAARHLDQADKSQRKAAAKERRTGDGRVRGAVGKAWRRAERVWDVWSAAAAAWAEVEAALALFTPEGVVNTRPRAEAALRAALPQLVGPSWSKVRRLLMRPQLLTFLDQAQQGLSSLPVAEPLREAAVQVEGLGRQPARLRSEGQQAAALRGMLVAAGLVLALSGAAGVEALALVRGVLGGVWRASSLVECLNSVARMQQGRHRKMTQGLLDLKRLYWNCRAFRTGWRRKQSPYQLQGLKLPTWDWWELLRWSPEQLQQQLQVAHAAEPPEKVSGPDVAA